MVGDEQDDRRYTVVINHEEQYSIWEVDREIPLGWSEVGKTGTKQEVLDYIEEVWTDMRPLSLRRHMFRDEVEQRFGRLAPDLATRIESADGGRLEGWRKRLGSAASAEELLGS